MPSKRYDTPHRSRVVKTRMTEEEYADFTARLAPYGISQSEFIRRAIQGASIRPVVTVSPVNDELFAALGKLTAEYGRIGNNLNQIARAIQRVRKYEDLDELTPYALRELVKAIYIEAPDKSSGKRHQGIRISYDLVGFIPVEELLKQETA